MAAGDNPMRTLYKLSNVCPAVHLAANKLCCHTAANVFK
jgi:hypothetical protein